jgi:hypothetical protein
MDEAYVLHKRWIALLRIDGLARRGGDEDPLFVKEHRGAA